MSNLEVWKTVPSLGCIEVSNFARVRLTVDRPNARWKNGFGTHRKGFVFTPRLSAAGYEVVRVTVDGKRKHRFVHRLVCEAFHGAPPTAKHHAAHKNGNCLDNIPENLYWATAQENINDRERHGKTSRGSHRYCAVLKEGDIPKIREMLSAGIPQRTIGEKFGVSNYAICDINRGKSWKHIG